MVVMLSIVLLSIFQVTFVNFLCMIGIGCSLNSNEFFAGRDSPPSLPKRNKP